MGVSAINDNSTNKHAFINHHKCYEGRARINPGGAEKGDISREEYGER